MNFFNISNICEKVDEESSPLIYKGMIRTLSDARIYSKILDENLDFSEKKFRKKIVNFFNRFKFPDDELKSKSQYQKKIKNLTLPLTPNGINLVYGHRGLGKTTFM